MSLIAGMMSGLGEGLGKAADIYAKHFLQQQAEEADKARMERLAELTEQANIRAEARKREPYKQAAAAAQQAISGATTYDEASGTPVKREPSAQEQTALKARAYEEAGLPEAASQLRTEALTAESIASRERQHRETLVSHERITTTQLDEQRRYHSGMLALQNAQLEETKKTGELDRAIKQFTIDNTKRVEALRTEFIAPGTTKERKSAITEEIQILTGKDNDKYLPVPLKDEVGNITGYKIFDTKRGEWVESKAGSGEPARPKTKAEVDALPVGALFVNPSDGKTYRKKGGSEAVLGGEGGFRASKARTDIMKPAIGSTLYKDPITGQNITAAQWRRKYGEEPS